jgi:glycerol-3-phosphate cytidylyltransferase
MLNLIKELKESKMIIGFTAGTFDLLHAGHVIMLEEAKSQCDYLIVGLLTDPTISRPVSKRKPYETTLERFIRLQAVRSVDYIVPFDTEGDLVNMLKILMPHKRFVGEEYRNTDHTGSDIEGIEIIYNSRRHNFSSTRTRQILGI